MTILIAVYKVFNQVECGYVQKYWWRKGTFSLHEASEKLYKERWNRIYILWVSNHYLFLDCQCISE